MNSLWAPNATNTRLITWTFDKLVFQEITILHQYLTTYWKHRSTLAAFHLSIGYSRNVVKNRNSEFTSANRTIGPLLLSSIFWADGLTWTLGNTAPSPGADVWIAIEHCYSNKRLLYFEGLCFRQQWHFSRSTLQSVYFMIFAYFRVC